jgi:hypothetical protein
MMASSICNAGKSVESENLIAKISEEPWFLVVMGPLCNEEAIKRPS